MTGDFNYISAIKVAGLGSFLLCYTSVVLYFLYKNFSVLDQPEMRLKYENLYKLVSLQRTKSAILFYPLYMTRRLLVVAIPTIIPEYIAPQMILLVLMHELYIISFISIRPHKWIVKLNIEIAIEVALMFLMYHMICFTEFPSDLEWQLTLGYQFIFIIVSLLFSGISFSMF